MILYRLQLNFSRLKLLSRGIHIFSGSICTITGRCSYYKAE